MPSKKTFLKNLISSIVVSKLGRTRIPKAVQIEILQDYDIKKATSGCSNIEDYFTSLALRGANLLLHNKIDVVHFLPDPLSRTIYKMKRNAGVRFNYNEFSEELLTDLSFFTNLHSINDVRDVISVCIMIGQSHINGGVKCVPLSKPRISSGSK